MNDPRTTTAALSLAALAGTVLVLAGCSAGAPEGDTDGESMAAPVVEAVDPAIAAGPYDGLTTGQVRTLAIRASRAGDWAALARHAEELVARRSDLAGHHELLAYALEQAGRPARAAEVYAIAMELDPENNAFVESRGRALIAAGRVREALDAVEAAADAVADPDLYHRLGTLATDAGLLDEAESAYRRALAVTGGTQARTQRALAELYRSIGDEGREMRHLRVLLYLLPDDESVKARVRMLGEIPGPSFALEPSLVDGTEAGFGGVLE